MKKYLKLKGIFLIIFMSITFLPSISTASVESKDIYEEVLDTFEAEAQAWEKAITEAASYLFWALAVISFTWTMAQKLLSRAEISEYFAELVRFFLFTGLFWWLLLNGATIASELIESMKSLAGMASGRPGALSPSQIADVGVQIFFRVLDNLSITNIGTSLAGVLLGIAITLLMGLIATNMLMLICSAWVLAYAGIFVLGFGGGRWTSDIAINYLKTVLSLALSIFTMILIVGIGQSIVDDYVAQMSVGMELKEITVIFIVALILFVLSNKVPNMVGGLISGANIGNTGGIGQMAAGAAIGGGATAATMAFKYTGAGAATSLAWKGVKAATRAGGRAASVGVKAGVGKVFGGDKSAGEPSSSFSDKMNN